MFNVKSETKETVRNVVSAFTFFLTDCKKAVVFYRFEESRGLLELTSYHHPMI